MGGHDCYNRSGLVVAQALIDLGMSTQDAITLIRAPLSTRARQRAVRRLPGHRGPTDRSQLITHQINDLGMWWAAWGSNPEPKGP
jgi:hypothetical protein